MAWWPVAALAVVLVAGLRTFQPQLRRKYQRWQTRRSLYRLSRAMHELPKWEPREQLDDETEAHGV